MNSRKRAAPGADMPLQPQSQQQQPVQDFSFDGQNFDWSGMNGMAGGLNPPYGIQPAYDNGYYENSLNPASGLLDPNGNPVNDSGTLVRRNGNHQLVSRGRAWEEQDPFTQQAASWETDDEADLEQQAAAAKRDAQAKRKQIPPFIQKLSSFLDESSNTDLIRWSDDGRSFIVLDEEEFAKTLIPELFKHNNYASFVRQLNMYGFHKKVGLSDNSMKASENKRKTPSEYWNKYFRRGQPELLWLIQKPKTAPPTKRKHGDGTKGEQSDEEKKKTVGPVQSIAPASAQNENQDLTTIPKTELSGLKNELVTLQRQQKLISNVIGQMKRQNDQLYQQASAFQAMHDKHENSINAILTFLATFYSRSLEGHGPPNLADMFKQAIGGQNQQPQGNIVEMSDLPNVGLNMAANNINPTPGRRRQLLLPAPDPKSSSTTTPRVANLRSTQTSPEFHTPSSTNLPSPDDGSMDNDGLANRIKVEADTPTSLGDAQDILSAINAANANSPASAGNQLDFNSALDHVQHADGNTPLTAQQRKDVLSLMANQSGADNVTDAGGSTSGLMNELTGVPAPDAGFPKQLSRTNSQLQMLQKLQDEQAAKVANLAERLGPLSPNGSIPGFYDAHVNGTPIPAPDWNLDDWINDGTNASNYDFDPNLPPDASYSDLGIALDDDDNGSRFTLGQNNDVAASNDGSAIQPSNADSGGRVESLPSRETSLTGSGDEGEHTGDTEGSAKKKRRTGT